MSDKLIFICSRAEKNLQKILEYIREDFNQNKKRNPIEHIKTRFKRIDSILGKLKRKKITTETDESITENVNDIIGARVVCPFLSDIEEIKEKIKNHPDLKFISEKDYIKNPKDSGYRSYHMNVLEKVIIDNEEKWVKAEIQVRTILMDMWASLEHKICYKKGIILPEEIKNELKELALLCQILDEELDKKKTEEIKEEKDLNLISEEEYRKLTQKYIYAKNEVLNKIEELNKNFKNKELLEPNMQNINPIEHIESRIKPASSLVNKLYTKMQEGTITSAEDAISDIAGVRIVCSFESDLFKIADIIKNTQGFEIEEIKDYVNNPKENGYSGYHLIVKIPYHHEDGFTEKVKVEIQIRTIAMDMWAIVERNLRYKNLTQDERQRQLQELARLRKNIDTKMNEIIKYLNDTQLNQKEIQNPKTKVLKREAPTNQ